MNREEFKTFAKAMKTFYPREQLLPSLESMEMWYRELADIPYPVAEAALRKYVATNKFSPTIEDIREMAATVENGDKPLWSDGWDQVLRSVRKYGSYRPVEAMESMDEITREAVRRLGYKELCMSENIMAERAQFRMIFEQIVDRRQTNSQISVNLAQLIEGIQNNRLEEGEKRAAIDTKAQ